MNFYCGLIQSANIQNILQTTKSAQNYKTTILQDDLIIVQLTIVPYLPNILTGIIEINYAGIRIGIMNEVDRSFQARRRWFNEMEVRNSVTMSEYLLKYIAEN